MSTPLNGLAIRDSRDGGQVYRTCGNCGERKALNADNFYRNKAHFSGFELKCKECQHARFRKVYSERYAVAAENRQLPPCLVDRKGLNREYRARIVAERERKAEETDPRRLWQAGLFEPHMIRAIDPEFSAYDRPGGRAIAAPGW
jgi:hypothetical protein